MYKFQLINYKFAFDLHSCMLAYTLYRKCTDVYRQSRYRLYAYTAYTTVILDLRVHLLMGSHVRFHYIRSRPVVHSYCARRGMFVRGAISGKVNMDTLLGGLATAVIKYLSVRTLNKVRCIQIEIIGVFPNITCRNILQHPIGRIITGPCTQKE